MRSSHLPPDTAPGSAANTPSGVPARARTARNADDVLDGLDDDVADDLSEGVSDGVDGEDEGEGEGEGEGEQEPGYTKRSSPALAYGLQRARAKAAARRGTGKGRKRATESRHSPRRIESVERQYQALILRRAGWSYTDIAKKMELACPQTAWNMVESALQRTLQEPADQVRKLELERLDALFANAFTKALTQKDMQASTQALNIMVRRARLLGLDAPVQSVSKTEITAAPQGTIVVPPVMAPAVWDKLAQAQQAEAMIDRAALDKAEPAGPADPADTRGQST